MARPARPWFRFYVEAMRDPKMRRLTPAQRWLWVAVLAAARESCVPGALYIAPDVPMTWEDMADYAGMKHREVADGAALFGQLGMVRQGLDGAWVVTAWNERQYESDDVTVRTRKHRSNGSDRNVPITFPGTPPETETDTDTERTLAPRARDELFDAVCAATNTEPAEITPSSRGAINKALQGLRSVGAMACEVPARAAVWRQRFPDAALTANALEKHWASLGTPVAPRLARGSEPLERAVAALDPGDLR